MTLQRIKRISRPHLTPSHRTAKPEPVRLPGGGYLNLEDPAVSEVFSRIGRNPKDYKLAKRVVTLQKKYPQGTVPELITLDWLDQKQIPYTYQAWLSGGRSRAGGVIPDVVFSYNGTGIAVLVQGNYWHNRPEVAVSDIADKLAIIGHYFENILLEKVVEVWEDDVYFRRPEVFEMMVLGIGLRGEVGRML